MKTMASRKAIFCVMGVILLTAWPHFSPAAPAKPNDAAPRRTSPKRPDSVVRARLLSFPARVTGCGVLVFAGVARYELVQSVSGKTPPKTFEVAYLCPVMKPVDCKEPTSDQIVPCFASAYCLEDLSKTTEPCFIADEVHQIELLVANPWKFDPFLQGRGSDVPLYWSRKPVLIKASFRPVPKGSTK